MTKTTTQNTTGSAADAKAPTDEQVHLTPTLQEAMNKIRRGVTQSEFDQLMEIIEQKARAKFQQGVTKREFCQLMDEIQQLVDDYENHRLPRRDEKDNTPSPASDQ